MRASHTSLAVHRMQTDSIRFTAPPGWYDGTPCPEGRDLRGRRRDHGDRAGGNTGTRVAAPGMPGVVAPSDPGPSDRDPRHPRPRRPGLGGRPRVPAVPDD